MGWRMNERFCASSQPLPSPPRKGEGVGRWFLRRSCPNRRTAPSPLPGGLGRGRDGPLCSWPPPPPCFAWSPSPACAGEVPDCCLRGRRDVLVEVEEVRGVVLLLDLAQAVPGCAGVGGTDAVGAFVGDEVD